MTEDLKRQHLHSISAARAAVKSARAAEKRANDAESAARGVTVKAHQARLEAEKNLDKIVELFISAEID